MTPETRYTRAGEVSIAYQVFGQGPLDLVLVPGWISNIELYWDQPDTARFFARLATFARVILFDKRGTGLSDRVTEAATLEERMDDVRAVLDAVGSTHAALLGWSEGGSMSILFAATYPERTAALITVGSYARRLRAPDYPYSPTASRRCRPSRPRPPTGAGRSGSRSGRPRWSTTRSSASGGRASCA